MKRIRSNNIFSLFLALSLSGVAQQSFAQNGDEEAMQNQAKLRDQKEIDRANKGWWAESMKTRDTRLAWWRDARFGMFIHWGVYSLPGGEWKGKKVDGYAEHLMRKEKITRKEYLELAHEFNPVKFDANKWVLAAKHAGMKYLIITAKHHDGFAMFDSNVSDFNIVKQTPWKHDPMADLVMACKKHGMKFGFYYSHAFDWEDPNAPGNDWEYNNPGGDKGLFGGANWFDVHPELLQKAVKYVDQKAIPQIKELLLKYHPDILWFDTPGKLPLSENIRILEAIRLIDPHVVINGRLARASNLNLGDYQNTADRPAEFFPVKGDWEAIPTTNESYGYSKYDHSHKSAKFFIQLLAKSASRGGNLLMNIGPEGDGTFDAADINILDSIGKWMNINAVSVYGTSKTTLPIQNWGVSTQKDNKFFLQVFDWPENQKLIVGGLKSKLSKAYLLSDPNKRPLKFKRINEFDLQLDLPVKKPDASNSVIVLQVEKPVVIDSVRLLSAHPNQTNRLLAFDALLSGQGFRFGDGKPGRYYVDGWKDKEQTMSWTFRLLQSANYALVLKYSADSLNAGTYEVIIDGKVRRGTAEGSAKNDTIKETDFGLIKLGPGLHTIMIKAVAIKEKGLMRVLELDLRYRK